MVIFHSYVSLPEGTCCSLLTLYSPHLPNGFIQLHTYSPLGNSKAVSPPNYSSLGSVEPTAKGKGKHRIVFVYIYISSGFHTYMDDIQKWDDIYIIYIYEYIHTTYTHTCTYIYIYVCIKIRDFWYNSLSRKSNQSRFLRANQSYHSVKSQSPADTTKSLYLSQLARPAAQKL